MMNQHLRDLGALPPAALVTLRTGLAAPPSRPVQISEESWPAFERDMTTGRLWGLFLRSVEHGEIAPTEAQL
jgi:hypothetical protein